jgi:hypothetical protein
MSFFSWPRNPKRCGVITSRLPQGHLRHRLTFRPRLEALEDRWMPSTLTAHSVADLENYVGPYGIAQNGDTIVFDSSLKGQTLYTSCPGSGCLGSIDIDIYKSVNIQGPGAANLAISGGHGSRVFRVEAGSQVNISGLTIENGNGSGGGFDPSAYDGLGGGILNFGNLTLNGCVVTGNSVYAGGGYGEGGGIANEGTMTLSGCTVTNNSAVYGGGGISNDGRYAPGGISPALTILNSTVTGNNSVYGAADLFSFLATCTECGSKIGGSTGKIKHSKC